MENFVKNVKTTVESYLTERTKIEIELKEEKGIFVEFSSNFLPLGVFDGVFREAFFKVDIRLDDEENPSKASVFVDIRWVTKDGGRNGASFVRFQYSYETGITFPTF